MWMADPPRGLFSRDTERWILNQALRGEAKGELLARRTLQAAFGRLFYYMLPINTPAVLVFE